MNIQKKLFSLSSILLLSAIIINLSPNIGRADPSTACNPLRNNVQSGLPTTTVSDSCIETVVTSGGISLQFKPSSFSFPHKFTTTYAQASFSNDDSSTPAIDATTGPEDILTVTDLRNSGGFTVNITASALNGDGGAIPLKNLYIVNTYPDSNDFDTLDTNLRGTQTTGVEYAAGSTGTQNITAAAFTSSSLNSATTYTTDGASFDAANDGTPDIITLMSTATAHMLRASQALSFYLNIPANQAAGTYTTTLTLDLVV